MSVYSQRINNQIIAYSSAIGKLQQDQGELGLT